VLPVLARTERPLLACLDQVSDPRNLGAVIRSAEGAGADGVVVGAHGSARVTAAVCRSSAGAVEHVPVAVVPNLARYLAEIKGGDLPGTIGPPLKDIKSKYPDRSDLVAILTDETKRNPQTMMPPFGRNRILTEQEINAIVDFLQTL